MNEGNARHKTRILDFASPIREPAIAWSHAATRNAVTVARCALPPNPGILLGASQLVLTVHMGDPFVMEYRPPGEDKLRSECIEPGMMHVNPGNRPFFQAWESRPDILVIALENSFAERVAGEAFERQCVNDIASVVGMRDDAALCFARLLDIEMAFERRGGNLVSEALAEALTVHLIRNFCPEVRPPPPIRGGLSPRNLRRALDRIETENGHHLTTEVFAADAGLSTRHFMRACPPSAPMAQI